VVTSAGSYFVVSKKPRGSRGFLLSNACIEPHLLPCPPGSATIQYVLQSALLVVLPNCQPHIAENMHKEITKVFNMFDRSVKKV
jgi:hypothetical protein